MNFQETVLAHMRDTFPEVVFAPGLNAARRSFDPVTQMDIVWDKERDDVRAELARYTTLLQFTCGLEQLTRDLKVVVELSGPVDLYEVGIRPATEEELGPDYRYRLDKDGLIAWCRRMN